MKRLMTHGLSMLLDYNEDRQAGIQKKDHDDDSIDLLSETDPGKEVMIYIETIGK